MIRSPRLRTRTLLASGLLTVAVALVLGLLVTTVSSLRDASDSSRHSEMVIAEATSLEKLLVDMETGVRGYVIAEQPRFLDPFETGQRNLPAASAQLTALVQDNPAQERRARAIVAAVESWRTAYARPLVRLVRREPDMARTLVEAAEGKRRVDAIRTRFATFTATEERLAGRRADNADTAELRAYVAAGAGLVGLIALVALLARFLSRAFEREEHAADELRLAQSRMAVLAGASETLMGSLDYERTLAEVARSAVPTVADWCSVEIATRDGEYRNVAVAHVDPNKVALARELQSRYPPDPDAPTGAPNVIRTGRSELFTDIPEELLERTVTDPEQMAIIRELGLRSAMTVPLAAHGRTLGAITLIAAESGRRYTADDLPFAEDLGRRAGVAIDNALLYGQERRIAETLQRSLLPDSLPALDRTAVGARYVPAEDEAEVGGDWYDVIALPGGELGLVIGDVVGHGVQAAAVMGQLRSAVRAYAVEGHGPAETVERVKALLLGSGPATMVGTLLVMSYDPGAGTLAFSSAGHPPPLVRTADGEVRFLEDGVAAPLGVDRRAAPAVEAPLDPGATVLLYTDGLVERRGESLTDGLARLEQVLETGPEAVEPLLDHVLGALGADGPRADDTAVLALAALGPRERGIHFDLPAERGSVTFARRAVIALLEDGGADPVECYELSVAVSDACANAIEHAYGPEDATFSVSAELNDGEVVIEVRDSGAWRPQRGTNRGRGLLLMDAYTDALEVDPGTGGTTVRMRRRLGAAAPA